MTRRSFEKNLAYVFLGALAGGGLYCAGKLLPRPPKKILVKEGELKRKRLFMGKEFVLVKGEEGWLALSRRCPHLGCLVGFDPGREEFVCPCHQSRFGLTGRYLSGPAKKDLARLPLRKTEGGFLLELPA